MAYRLTPEHEKYVRILAENPHEFERIPTSIKDDRYFVQVIATINRGELYKYLSDHIRADKDIAKAYICRNGLNLEFAPEEIRKNAEFILTAVVENPLAQKFVVGVKDEKMQVLMEIAKDVNSFKDFPKKYRQNDEIIKFTISNTPPNQVISTVLKHIDLSKIKNIQEIICKAINNDFSVYDSDYNQLKENEKVVSCAIRNGLRFSSVPESLKENEEVVYAGLEQDGSIYLTLSEELRNNYRLARRATDTSPYIIGKITNRDIVIELLDNWYGIKEHFLMELYYNDFEICKRIFKKNGNLYSKLVGCPDDSLLYNKELIEIAVTNYPAVLEHVPLELRTFDICLLAVQKQGLTLKYCNLFTSHVDIITAAITQNADSLEFADTITYEIVELAIKKNGTALRHARQFRRDKDIIFTAILNSAAAYPEIPSSMLDIPGFIDDCFQQNPKIYRYLDNDRKNNLAIVRAALEYSTDLIQYVPKSIQLENRELILDIATMNPRGFTFGICDEYKKDEEFMGILIRGGECPYWVPEEIRLKYAASHKKSARK